MFNKLKFMSGIMLVSAITASPASLATIFSYEDTSANNGNSSFGDQLDSLSTTYNDANDRFTWDVVFNANSGVDGFWLVVNNGSNPKAANVNELAIMYGDIATGKLSTYVYNGANNADSIDTPGIHLQTDIFTTGVDSFSFDIDVSAINAYAGWDTPTAGDINGVGYDKGIGAWFHIAKDSNFGYDLAGNIDSFSFGSQGWYDFSNRRTTQVPEPATALLLGFGLVGLVLGRRKKTKI